MNTPLFTPKNFRGSGVARDRKQSNCSNSFSKASRRRERSSNRPRNKKMKTVIKNSAQGPCPALSLTPRFSEVDHHQRRHLPLLLWQDQLGRRRGSGGGVRLSCRARPNPSISDQIRLTFLTRDCLPINPSIHESNSIRSSPTQSNRIQPNPTAPPPPGKVKVKKW